MNSICQKEKNIIKKMQKTLNCVSVTSISKHTVISSGNSLWGTGVSLSFGQRSKALCLTRLQRRRKRIGGLYLPLLQAGARERFAFVVAEEREIPRGYMYRPHVRRLFFILLNFGCQGGRLATRSAP